MIQTPRFLGVAMALLLALFPLLVACAPGEAKIVVLVDGVAIAPLGEYDFGPLGWSDPWVDKTATIRNTGDDDLTLNGTVTITNNFGTEFTLISPPSGTIPAGGEVQFTIRYDTMSTFGTVRETVTIASNDPDNSSYAFDVFGTSFC